MPFKKTANSIDHYEAQLKAHVVDFLHDNYGVEPFLCRHYDRMERRDPLKQKYDMNKPTYEYNK